MGGIRLFLPIPDPNHPLSIENADTAFFLTEKGLLEPLSRALEAFHVESVCGFCGPVGIALKALGLLNTVNEGVTFTGRFSVHDMYYTKPPLQTPFDDFPE